MLKHLLATTALAVALGWGAQAQEAVDPAEPAEETQPAAEPMAESHDGEVPLEEEGAAAEEAPAADDATETAEPAVPAEEGTTTAEEAPPEAMEEGTTTAEPAAPAVEGTTTAEEAPAEETEPMTAEPADPMAPAADPATGVAEAPPLVPADIATLTVEDLVGANLRNAGGENLGTVDDALLDDGGNIESLIISFGGFLGFGSKTVEVALDEVELMRDDGNNVVVQTSMTPEALEAMPVYEEAAEG